MALRKSAKLSYATCSRRIEVPLCKRFTQVTAIRVLSNIYLASEMPGESLRAANDAVHLACIHESPRSAVMSEVRERLESEQPRENFIPCCMLQQFPRQMCKRVHVSRLQTRRRVAHKFWVGEHRWGTEFRHSGLGTRFLTAWNSFL